MKKISYRYILANVALAVIYFIFAKLGLKLAFTNPSATPIWPPTGIALAALLIAGYRLWPGVLVGAFFANVTTAGTIITSLGIAGGNTLEALVGAYLVNRFAHGLKAFDEIRDIFKFGILAGMVATAISATIGVSSLVLGGLTKLSEYGSVWFTWWLGDFGGAVIIAPFLILWNQKSSARSKKQIAEFILYLVAIWVVGQVVFGNWLFVSSKHYPLEFLLVPILLLVAVRLGKREEATAIVFMSWIAIWDTLHGLGPFAVENPATSLLLLQAFILVVALPKMLIASFQENLKAIDKTQTEFISIASHQLRAPLSSISWLVHSLQKNMEKRGLDSQEEAIFKDLELSLARAKTSVGDLLSTSRISLRITQINKARIDIKEVLEAFMESFMPYAKSKEHSVEFEIKEYEPTQLLIDRNVLFNVLQNLLTNAVNYSPEHTKVTLALEKEDDAVKISVTNRGPEIPKEEQKNIFNKFYRGEGQKTKTEGSGLGLYIAKSFVEDMGGSIGFESNPTETTFWFKIPTV